MTNSPTNSMKIITSSDPMTIDKDQVIDPNINTFHTITPTSLNEFSTHDEAVNTAGDQRSVLNSDLNQPTEDIINTLHITSLVNILPPKNSSPLKSPFFHLFFE